MGKKASQEYYTPEWVLLMVLAVLGRIDLDPCSNALKTVPARRHYVGTKGQSGLILPWGEQDYIYQANQPKLVWLHPFTVFVNPPWQDLLPWIEKMLAEYQAGHFSECILLVPARIGRPWFQLLSDRPVWLPEGRINYNIVVKGKNGLDVLKPTNQIAEFSCAFYLGPDEAKFARVFGQKGHVRPGIGRELRAA